jgi:hypothetical protein
MDLDEAEDIVSDAWTQTLSYLEAESQQNHVDALGRCDEP